MLHNRFIIIKPIKLFLLFAVIAKAQPSFRWNVSEEKNQQHSITSGIRNLENMRREIVESTVNQPGNSRELFLKKKQPIKFGRLIYDFDKTAAGNKRENYLAIKRREVGQPRRQVDSAMYEALSKLAKIRIADTRQRDSSTRINSQDTSAVDVDERLNEAVTNNGFLRTLNTEVSTQKKTTPSSKLHFAPRKFNCHPIREIYIPMIDEKMPAYACTLGKRAFVISSKRFLQDSRGHFEINVDESTYKRLTPMNSEITSLTSGVSVLPATLVLRQGEDGYTVRGVNANWKEVQALSTVDN